MTVSSTATQSESYPPAPLDENVSGSVPFIPLNLVATPNTMLEMPAKAKAPITVRKSAMSNEHKEALALGREESRTVRRYLEALESNRPNRGRKRTAVGIENRLVQIEELTQTADPLSRLHLAQEQIDLEHELATFSETIDITDLEEGFVSSARNYGERKGISYSAWREAGVSAAVLRQAGIARTRT